MKLDDLQSSLKSKPDNHGGQLNRSGTEQDYRRSARNSRQNSQASYNNSINSRKEQRVILNTHNHHQYVNNHSN